MSEQTRLELERGRIIAERAKRGSDLDRYVAGKKVKLSIALPGHTFYQDRGRVNLFYVDEVCCAHQNQLDDDYPSEVVMATIAMAVNATVGIDGIPAVETIDPAERALRNAYRDKFLGQWRAIHDKDKGAM